MKELYKSLGAFQSEVPIICKETQGFGYTYADLPAIVGVIKPLLKKHGLSYLQSEEGGYMLTRIIHSESGATLESRVSMPETISLKGMNDYQSRGAALTYFRRYSLSLALGLVTDKDTDAYGEQIRAPQKAPVQKSKEMLMLDSPMYQKIIRAIEKGKTDLTMDRIKKKYIVPQNVEEYLNQSGIY